MPLITVQLFEGRTVEQKRAYAKALTDASVQVLGIDPGAVDVIFSDVDGSLTPSAPPFGARRAVRARYRQAGTGVAKTCRMIHFVTLELPTV